MKKMNSPRVTRLAYPCFGRLLASCFLCLVTFCANASVLYESAMLGPTGIVGGSALRSQWSGSRFTLTEASDVLAIGGHLNGSGGTIFGAIIPMVGLLPNFDATVSALEANALVGISFAPGSPSTDFRSPLSIRLAPGDYALIFGGSEGSFGPTSPFGATGTGALVQGQTDTAAGIGSYFTRLPFSGGSWVDGGNSGLRFVVEGRSVPEPAALTLLSLGIAVFGYQRRKQLSA